MYSQLVTQKTTLFFELMELFFAFRVTCWRPTRVWWWGFQFLIRVFINVLCKVIRPSKCLLFTDDKNFAAKHPNNYCILPKSAADLTQAAVFRLRKLNFSVPKFITFKSKLNSDL